MTETLRSSYPVLATTKKEKEKSNWATWCLCNQICKPQPQAYTHTFTVAPFRFYLSFKIWLWSNWGEKNAAWNRQNLLINDNLRPFSFTWRIDLTQIHTRFYFLFLVSATCFFGHSKLGAARTLNEWQLSTAHTSRSLLPNALEWLNVFRLKSGKDIMASLGPFPPYAEELVKPRVGACLTSDRERERGDAWRNNGEKERERERERGLKPSGWGERYYVLML